MQMSENPQILKGMIEMEQKNQTKKLPGFYIALCCCVIAVGIAGFFAQNMETESTNALTEVTQEPQSDIIAESTAGNDLPLPQSQTIVVAEENTAETPVQPAAHIEPAADTAAETADDYTADNPDCVPASTIVSAQESTLFADPLPDMTILAGFSDNKLVYNEFYGDWRAHCGIDIAADAGSEVHAAANGTVTQTSPSSYGNQITIEHENGFKTVYAQLGETNVSVGDSVSQGDVIAFVGESTGENVQKPHLHFEILKDNVPQNPEEY